MTKKIMTYDDLLAEKQRLQELVDVQKTVIRQDWRELKAEFQPAINVASFASKIFTRDKSNPLLNMGVNTAIDILFKRLILSKAGWFGRTIIPFFMKNLSSHVVDEYAGTIKEKIFSIFTSKNGKHTSASDKKQDVKE